MPIDLLINNAGIVEGGPFDATTKIDLLHQFDVNAVGPFLMTRALLPNLKLVTNGAFVVQISSFLGSIQLNAVDSLVAGGYYGYRASKAVLNMINKSMSVDRKGDNVGFLAIHPGYVATNLSSDAPGAISTETSVNGIAKVIADAKLEDSGKFLDYEGQTLPW